MYVNKYHISAYHTSGHGEVGLLMSPYDTESGFLVVARCFGMLFVETKMPLLLPTFKKKSVSNTFCEKLSREIRFQYKEHVDALVASK